MTRVVLLAGGLLLAGCATAPVAAVNPAASAHAEARTLIAAAGAAGVFEDATTDATPALRHIQSGMLCFFTPGDPINGVMVYPPMGGLSRGENVACNTRARGMTVSLYATRYAGRMTEEQDLDASSATILRRWPAAALYEGGFALLSAGDEAEPPRHAAFTLDGEDGYRLTYVLIRHHGPWGFKMRASAPDGDMATRALAGGMMFMHALSTARRQTAE